MKSSTQNFKSKPKSKSKFNVASKQKELRGSLAKTTNETFKIQKVLANVGVASRRTIEEWLKEGKVIVNGKVANLGERINIKAKVSVNGKPIELSQQETSTEFLIYHKPVGEICSKTVDVGTGSVFANLPKPVSGRWVMIGRLDVNTSGLLLFTNSGDEAHKYMHPKFELEREYHVRVLGIVTPEMLKKFQQGILLEDGMAKFDKITPLGGRGGANSWFKVVLKEGRNREVRRLFESQGLIVSRLIRTRFGQYQLPKNLRPGQALKV